jgi:hypothetical protein
MVNYKDIIESRYNREKWVVLLHDIFGNRASIREPYKISNNSNIAKNVYWLGKITLSDDQSIAIYEVELNDSVDIERNRRGIRDMLLTEWRGNYVGAFMFCYRQNEGVLRFSYVSESWTFAEDGTYQKESTDTKRFTYLLGEGHRSRTAIQQFEKLRDSSLTLKDLTKAFSVDAVSDMFFDGYKKQYEDIIQYITGKRMVKVANKWEEQIKNDPCEEIMQEFAHFSNPEKAVRDYVKKLMGRLVFLQFLQKKGWLGVPAGEPWGKGDTEFIQTLFAQCNDKDHFVDNVLEVLFNDLNTEREGDLATPSIGGGRGRLIPYLNGGLFERDATDETEFPLPAKYMQSLLDFFASYNFTIDENDPDDAEVGVDPEMLGRIFENLLEDNKDKGAFYTPKEIVSYMCRESLIAYLQTGFEDETTKEAIRQFVTTHDAEVLGSKASPLWGRLEGALRDVKICDPAIGSGAFPMGLLKELFQCRTALEGIEQSKAAEIKKHIIQQNIYGVDIERGAVDIARLRFWLSLIVDEETPQALPNLDFKIMQGNSLLEQYKGVDLSKLLPEKVIDKQVGLQATFFDEEFGLEQIELQELLNKYYDCTQHEKKILLRNQISQTIQKQIHDRGIRVNFGGLDLSGNNEFFLWHTWFYDVLSKGGFDIVIGNPPYVAVRSGNIPEDAKNTYKKIYKSAIGQFDLYALFMEKGLNILTHNGILVMITESTYLSNKDFMTLRKLLIQNNTICKLLYLGEEVFKTANVDVSIGIIRHTNLEGSQIEICQSYEDFLKKESSKVSQNTFNDETSNYEIKIRGGLNGLLLYEKIKNKGVMLGKIVEMPRGTEFGANADFIKESPQKNYERIIVGKDIVRYGIKPSQRYILFDEKNVSMYKEHRFYSQPKLFVQRIRNLSLPDRIIATYDDTGIVCTNTLRMIVPKNSDYDIKAILGILNSKLINYIFRTLFLNKDIYKFQLERIPIPQTSSSIGQLITQVVNNALTVKCSNSSADTSTLESEIDLLVYQLYGLTYDEVLLVDPKTPITREEYIKKNP